MEVNALYLLRVVKFVGVILFGGGLIASFVTNSERDRKRAVHAISSPGLLVTWGAGYLLTLSLGVPLTELWVMGGLVFSLASQLALVRNVSRQPSRAGFALTAVPLLFVLVFMVVRPTWSSVLQ